MQQEQQPRTPENQKRPDFLPSTTPGVDARIGMQRSRTNMRAKFLGAGVVLGAFLLGILMVRLFPEFVVSKVIYAMVGK